MSAPVCHAELKPLAALKFARPLIPALPERWGQAARLEWIALDKLVVDASYQRDILEDGRKRIRRIAEHFRWSHFAPLVVSPRDGGVYAIIDGQHHAAAALLVGATKLPCCVIACTPAEEASAFAAINGDVTKPNALQIFHARLAARDAKALLLRKICDESGVTIPRNVQLVNKPGQTLAIATLLACLDRYGGDVLTTALELITRTASSDDDNTGLVRAPIMVAFCECVKFTPKAKRAFLASVVARAPLRKLYATALRIAAVDGGGLRAAFAAQLRKAIDRERVAA